jgi:hypothetical protein
LDAHKITLKGGRSSKQKQSGVLLFAPAQIIQMARWQNK